MTFSLKNLDRTCLTLVVLVMIAGGYWLFNYHIKDQRRITKETELASRRSTELSIVEENLHLLKKALNMKRDRFKALHQQTTETPDIGSFLKELNRFIEKNKIGLISIRPMPPLKEDHYTRLPVQLVCKGSFGGIFELLRDLEGMKKTVLMEKMAVSRPNVEQACGLELTATILQYNQRMKSF